MISIASCGNRVLISACSASAVVAQVVAAAPAGVEDVEHPAQRGLTEPAQGPRRESEPLTATLHVPLPAQLAFDLAQLGDVVHRLPAERALDELLVDVVQARA